MAKANKKKSLENLSDEQPQEPQMDAAGNEIKKADWERAEVIEELQAKVNSLKQTVEGLEKALTLSDSLLKEETDSLIERNTELAAVEKKVRELQRSLERQTKNVMDYACEVDKLQRRLERIPIWVKKLFNC